MVASRRLALSYALLASLLATREARAESATPATVNLHADARCGDATALEARLLARARPGRALTVNLRASTIGFRGDVRISDREDDAEVLVRSVEARTCEGVVLALALVVALDARGTEAREPEGTTELREADVTVTEASEAPPRSPERDAHASTPVREARSRVDVGLGLGGFVSQLSTRELVGVAAFGDLAWDEGMFGVPWWRPSLRLGVAGTLPPDSGASRAAVTTRTGRLDGCPLGAGLGAGFRLSACARLEVGVIRADAEGYDPSSRLFASSGAIVALRWMSGPPVGSARFFAELSGGQLFPITRPVFVPRPTSAGSDGATGFFVVGYPTLQLTGALALGVVLP